MINLQDLTHSTRDHLRSQIELGSLRDPVRPLINGNF
jgi:hypothetical protein